MYKVGDRITWKSLATGKVRTGYIVSINPNGTYQVKNQYGDEHTVSKEYILDEKSDK